MSKTIGGLISRFFPSRHDAQEKSSTSRTPPAPQSQLPNDNGGLKLAQGRKASFKLNAIFRRNAASRKEEGKNSFAAQEKKSVALSGETTRKFEVGFQAGEQASQKLAEATPSTANTLETTGRKLANKSEVGLSVLNEKKVALENKMPVIAKAWADLKGKRKDALGRANGHAREQARLEFLIGQHEATIKDIKTLDNSPELAGVSRDIANQIKDMKGKLAEEQKQLAAQETRLKNIDAHGVKIMAWKDKTSTEILDVNDKIRSLKPGQRQLAQVTSSATKYLKQGEMTIARSKEKVETKELEHAQEKQNFALHRRYKENLTEPSEDLNQRLDEAWKRFNGNT